MSCCVVLLSSVRIFLTSKDGVFTSSSVSVFLLTHARPEADGERRGLQLQLDHLPHLGCAIRNTRVDRSRWRNGRLLIGLRSKASLPNDQIVFFPSPPRMTDGLEMKASLAAGIVVDQSRSRSRGGCELFRSRFRLCSRRREGSVGDIEVGEKQQADGTHVQRPRCSSVASIQCRRQAFVPAVAGNLARCRHTASVPLGVWGAGCSTVVLICSLTYSFRALQYALARRPEREAK